MGDYAGFVSTDLMVFQQVSLISVLANMIVVPWFGLVIMPCVFWVR